MYKSRENPYGSFMKYWAIVETNALQNNPTLKQADLKLLLYLESYEYYTSKAIKIGKLMIPRDVKRHQRLKREGWIKLVPGKYNHRAGEHDKLTLTTKARLLVTRIYKQLIGEESIPENPYSNEIFKKKRKVDDGYIEMIKIFNRDKER